MKRISQILSSIFTPLLVPTIAMAVLCRVSILALLPAHALWLTVAVTFVLTGVLPALCIYALYRSGVVSDPGLNNRSERTIPYAIAAVCYLGCSFFMYRMGAPSWLNMFFAAGAVAIAINAIVSFKWKISAHAASMGGFTAMFFRLVASHIAVCDINIWLSAAILLTGMVMTARVYLGRHTLWQVLAGAANGFLCVWFLTMFH